MGAEAFYAAAATALKMPVAFNTQDRDRKMVAEGAKQKLAAFLKAGGNTLNVDGGNATHNRKAESGLTYGFDAVKLVEDDNYRAQMYEKHMFDPDMLDKLDAAASVGRSALEKQSKK